MSTNYRVSIYRTEPNPLFAEQIKKYEEENRRGYNSRGDIFDPNRPREEIEKNVLLVELTEEEFKVVKASVIETFK